MSLLFVVIVLAFLWKCRINLRSMNDDYLSIENSTALRGILSVLVVCYHLAQRTGDRSLFHIFVFFGFLPVSYFFFLSGYGLQKSFAKKANYRGTILRKRIPSVALPYLFFTGLYCLLSWVEGDAYALSEVLLSFVNGGPVVTFSWYILCILLIYLVYYITTAFYRGNHDTILILNLLFVAALPFVFKKLGYGGYWYSTCITYPLGIFWAIKEEKILPWIKKHYLPLLAAGLVASSVLFLSTMRFSSGRVILWLYWPCCLLFVPTLLLVQMKVTFGNRLLTLLGNCSMEIYMFHGFFMSFYRGTRVYLEDPLIWCVAVLVSTGIGAYGMNSLFGAMRKKKTGKPA